MHRSCTHDASPVWSQAPNLAKSGLNRLNEVFTQPRVLKRGVLLKEEQYLLESGLPVTTWIGGKDHPLGKRTFGPRDEPLRSSRPCACGDSSFTAL